MLRNCCPVSLVQSDSLHFWLAQAPPASTKRDPTMPLLVPTVPRASSAKDRRVLAPTVPPASTARTEKTSQARLVAPTVPQASTVRREKDSQARAFVRIVGLASSAEYARVLAPPVTRASTAIHNRVLRRWREAKSNASPVPRACTADKDLLFAPTVTRASTA